MTRGLFGLRKQMICGSSLASKRNLYTLSTIVRNHAGHFLQLPDVPLRLW